MIQKKIRSLIYAGLGLILCVLLCGGIGMTAQAYYEDDDTYNGFKYFKMSDGVSIDGYIGDETELVIPEEIDGVKVTCIGENAFWGKSNLTSITIPEGVTKLERSTFNDCSSLTSVTLPKSLTSIRGWAFDNCSSLTSIIIPDGVTCISFHAFANCSKLTYVAIPDSVTEFEEYDVEGELLAIFENSPNVTIICNKDSAAYKYATEHNIPVKLVSETENPSNDPKQNNTKPVTPAKKGTTLTVASKKLKVKVTSSSKKNPTVTITKFTDKKAKKLTIPATVKVKGVTYKVTAVSDKAFKGNKKLTTVTIGKNVTSIGSKAFYKCTKLSSIVIPAKVKTIGSNAFFGCKNLKKITVTAGKLKTISKNAFKGINKKATITMKGTKKAKTALKKQLKKKSIGYVKTWKIK